MRHTLYENPDNIYPFHLPVVLSKKGREDAHNIGKWLSEKDLGVPIFSSPIVRAVQTSEIIDSHTNSHIKVDDRLIETYCPNFQGHKKIGHEPWKSEEDDISREPRKRILSRAMNIINDKLEDYSQFTLVTHGDLASLLLYHFKDKKPPRHIWSPENRNNIIDKGMILEISYDANEVVSFTTHANSTLS